MRRSVCFALLLMLAVFCAQTAWLASDCGHEHSSQHCCGLCHAGPMTFVATAIVHATAPVVGVEWVAAWSGATMLHEVLSGAGSSRAPPA